MAGFGIWWAPFEHGHPYTERMGMAGERKLPVLLEWDTYEALLRGDEIEYRFENLLFGMLIMLDPYPKQLVPFDPDEFADALKYLGQSCGDSDCERMLALTYSYMKNEHTDDDAKAIGKIAKTYFGIDSYYVGDN